MTEASWARRDTYGFVTHNNHNSSYRRYFLQGHCVPHMPHSSRGWMRFILTAAPRGGGCHAPWGVEEARRRTKWGPGLEPQQPAF